MGWSWPVLLLNVNKKTKTQLQKSLDMTGSMLTELYWHSLTIQNTLSSYIDTLSQFFWNDSKYCLQKVMKLSHVGLLSNIKCHHIHYSYWTYSLLHYLFAVRYQPGAAVNFLSLKAHDRKKFKGKEFFSNGPGHILQPEDITEGL